MKTTFILLAILLACAVHAHVEPGSFAEVSSQAQVDATMVALNEDSMEAAELAATISQEAGELAEMVEAGEAPASLIEAVSAIESERKHHHHAKAASAVKKAAPAVNKAGKAAVKVVKAKAAAVKAKAAAALKSLAGSLKAGGKKSRKSLLKNKKSLKKMAKKLGLSAKQVKQAIKNPKKALKKASKLKKQAKKAVKKAAKAAAKAAGTGKFIPKEDSIMMKKTDLTKQLKGVVEGEPESAAVAKAKDNWAWEDAVFSRLDQYVPPDPKNIKTRIEKFSDEADEQCNKAGILCVQSNPDHPINPKTCVKAKKACYHAKVALKVITKASVVCVDAVGICGRKDWKGKGDCLVAKAKCKRLMMAVDYQYKKTQHASKVVRDMDFNDKEANEMRDKVEKEGEKAKAAQTEHDAQADEAKACVKASDEWKQCELNMDKSDACKKAKKLSEKCQDDEKLPKFEKAKDKLKAAKKALDKSIQEKNAAEKEAKQG